MLKKIASPTLLLAITFVVYAQSALSETIGWQRSHLLPAVRFAAENAAPAERGDAGAPIKPGDTAVVAADGVRFMVGPDVLATLPRGALLCATQIEDSWVGGHVEINGRRQPGWVQRSDLQLLVSTVSAVIRKDAADEAGAEQTEPAAEEAGEAEPAAEQAEPAAEQAEQVAEETEPAAEKSEPAAEQAEPAAEKTEPAAEQAEPAAEKAEPAPKEVEPAAEKAEPEAEQAEAAPKKLKLPLKEEKFDLETLIFRDNAGLATLDQSASIEKLVLYGDGVTNTGLKHVGALARVGLLSIEQTRITDGGLALLAKMKDVRSLRLWQDRFTDAALARINGLTSLRSLDIDGTQVRGEGLEHLKGLEKLRSLTLGREIQDADLERLAALLPNLEELDLRGCRQVTDAGLAHIPGLSKLQALWLPDGITDAGLEPLAEMKGLKSLWLSEQISDEAKGAFGKQLPECEFLPGEPTTGSADAEK
ncbi:MAG: hypothetical protein ABIP48_04170 [Planctomycetota bacterium]